MVVSGGLCAGLVGEWAWWVTSQQPDKILHVAWSFVAAGET